MPPKSSSKKLLSYSTIRQSFSGENKYPGFHTRMIASLIDCTLMSIILIPFFTILGNLIFFDATVSPTDMLNQATMDLIKYNEQNNSFLDLISFVKQTPLYYEYFITEYGLIKIGLNQILQLVSVVALILVFWTKKQATPGKMMMSMKIVDAKTLKKPTKKQLIIRMLSYIISVLPLFLGVLWVVFDKRKQAWHDKIAGTIVIKS
jgi:uncharacterized RDD family membrane protein YckC